MNLLPETDSWSPDVISTNSSSLLPGDALAETNKTAPRPPLQPSLPQNDLLKVPLGPTPEFLVLETNAPADSVTHVAPAPLVLSELTGPSSNLVGAVRSTNSQDRIRNFHLQLDQARQQRRDGQPVVANRLLISMLETNAPAELKRAALLELALVAQGENQLLKAQQIFAQFVRLYPLDPRVPEVLLRQGLLYRQLGVSALALSKFYAVMTSALALKLDRIVYYQRLVLQAQTEIADTYYLEGKHAEAADFFQRLLKLDSPELNRVQIQFKLIRALAALDRPAEVVAQAQDFIERYANALEQPEARFQLATALKQLGRNREAMRQVLVLLESQQSSARQNPDNWIYW
jgi:tetratricopeptide (TPR) repeat protein